VWIVGAVVVVVIAACVIAIFSGGKTGPFAALSQLGRDGKIHGVDGVSDYQDGLRKPRNENELL
jgi:hypothetical protein